MGGAIRHRLRRRGHALLVAYVCASRTHARSYEQSVRPQCRTHGGHFTRRTDDAVSTVAAGKLSQRLDLCRHRTGDAEIVQIGLVKTGQDRDGQNLRGSGTCGERGVLAA